MDPQQILDRLDAVLEKERLAIRRLDGSGVEAAAAEKTALVQSLTGLAPETRKQFAGRLTSLVEQLRRNGVLLVHARGILRDVLRLRGAELASGGQAFSRQAAILSAARLSIRG